MAKLKKLILYPFNGTSREAFTVVKAINKVSPILEVIGFADDDQELWDELYHGVPILGGKEAFIEFPEAYVLASPGRVQGGMDRHQVIRSLRLPVKRFATVIHPNVEIGIGVKVGFNTIIMSGVVMTADVSIGNHCIILPNSVIAHDSRVKDYSIIGAGAKISGGVDIRENCFIGSGACINADVDIGENSVIEGGSVVLGSVPPESTVEGNPGQILSEA